MRIGVVVMAMMFCGCTGANRVALGVSTASLACDWAQTRSSAKTGWMIREENGKRYEVWETNPIMGNKPSVGEVDLYFATAAVANLALWLALPRRYKSIIPGAITTAEVYSISRNVSSTNNIATGNAGFCGM